MDALILYLRLLRLLFVILSITELFLVPHRDICKVVEYFLLLCLLTVMGSRVRQV